MEPSIASKKQEGYSNVQNTQLIEARICHLISSLRALTRSNKELEAALIEEPDDYDYISAIKENRNVIQTQLQSVMELVNKMKEFGAHDYQLPDDILQITIISPSKESQVARESSTENGNNETRDEGLYL